MRNFFSMPPSSLKPRASFRKARIVLSILTVAVGVVAVYLYAMPIGWFYVTLESPESLPSPIPIIRNPNPFLLEAIENSGKRINVYGGQLESHWQLSSLVESVYGWFEYEGRYYRFHWEWTHPEIYRVFGSFRDRLVYERRWDLLLSVGTFRGIRAVRVSGTRSLLDRFLWGLRLSP